MLSRRQPSRAARAGGGRGARERAPVRSGPGTPARPGAGRRPRAPTPTPRSGRRRGGPGWCRRTRPIPPARGRPRPAAARRSADPRSGTGARPAAQREHDRGGPQRRELSGEVARAGTVGPFGLRQRGLGATQVGPDGGECGLSGERHEQGGPSGSGAPRRGWSRLDPGLAAPARTGVEFRTRRGEPEARAANTSPVSTGAG